MRTKTAHAQPRPALKEATHGKQHRSSLRKQEQNYHRVQKSLSGIWKYTKGKDMSAAKRLLHSHTDCSITHNNQSREASYVSSDEDRAEDVVCLYNVRSLSHEKQRSRHLQQTWMNLEDTRLSEISQTQKRKNKQHDPTYM